MPLYGGLMFRLSARYSFWKILNDEKYENETGGSRTSAREEVF